MSYNPNAPARSAGIGRKVKRVSDVAAMGMAPTAAPYQQPGSYDSSFGGPMNQSSPQNFDGGYEPPGYGFNPPAQSTNFQTYPTGDSFTPPPIGGVFQPPPPSQFGSMLQQPIVQDMAMQYGQQLANHGKDLVHREIGKYVMPVSVLKYYFAVDTKYVLNKLLLIFFPYTNKDWSIKYEQDAPLQPRFEPNAPDLYIPTMAYITYIVLAGFVLGMQHRFSPEQIGIQASSALAYSLFEIGVYLAILYIMNIETNLRTLDLLSFSGYKYTIIIASILTSIVFQKVGYYSCLIYGGISLSFFLVRTLKVQVLVEPTNQVYPQDAYSQTRHSGGTKRRVYFLLFVASMQPLLSWWLTYHLLPLNVTTPASPPL